jgi:hypothetical protein
MRCDANGGLSVCLSSPIWVNTHTSVDSQTKSRVSDFGIAFRGLRRGLWDPDYGRGNNSRNPNPEGVVVSNPGVSEERNGWMRGVTGIWCDGVDPGYRDGGDDEATNRTVPFVLFTFGLITLTEPPVTGYVRAYVRTPFEGTDGNRARWLSEAKRVRRIETRGRTDVRARDVGNTEDGGRVKRKE